MNKKVIIDIKDVKKTFNVGKGKVEVLKGIDLQIHPGEFVIIFGPSGCGKSTLLNTIVGLEKPTSGTVAIRGTKIYELKEDDRSRFRLKKFGMVHQQPMWIKSLNILENVAFPMCITGCSERRAARRARELLTLFRLEQFEKSIPTELSGGQQQRASIVRALITNPWILIADEPTGNLDTNSALDLIYALKLLNEESKRTIIMVTHNPDYERYATKVIRMEDGKINSVETKKKVDLEETGMGDIIPQMEAVPDAN